MVDCMSDGVMAVMSTKESSISSHKEEEYDSLHRKYLDNKFEA